MEGLGSSDRPVRTETGQEPVGERSGEEDFDRTRLGPDQQTGDECPGDVVGRRSAQSDT